jgi:1-acyl-sn-glycerol-3-phosphate acyltransferase
LTLEFLEPIAPGEEREAFMARLRDRIESASERLRHEAGDPPD